jgi:hypothetical protein
VAASVTLWSSPAYRQFPSGGYLDAESGENLSYWASEDNGDRQPRGSAKQCWANLSGDDDIRSQRERGGNHHRPLAWFVRKNDCGLIHGVEVTRDPSIIERGCGDGSSHVSARRGTPQYRPRSSGKVQPSQSRRSGAVRLSPSISLVAKKGGEWAMSGDDVRMGGYGTSSGHSKPLARSSRRNGLTSSTMYLIHKPTGLRVDGTVPSGHYSRKEMVKERERLHKHLWDELERKVANHLRIPGRQGTH